jgi:hypothetical protein
MDRDRQKMEWEMKTQQVDDQRRLDEDRFHQSANDLHVKMQNQEEDLRRRQRDNMNFMQVSDNPFDVYVPFCHASHSLLVGMWKCQNDTFQGNINISIGSIVEWFRFRRCAEKVGKQCHLKYNLFVSLYYVMTHDIIQEKFTRVVSLQYKSAFFPTLSTGELNILTAG